MTAKDRAEFQEFLDACSDAQVRGVYDKEFAARRMGYVAVVKAEMKRRNIT